VGSVPVVVPATVALMIVISFHGVDERSAADGRRKQDDDRGVIKKVRLDEHTDLIREAVKAVVAELMGIEVSKW
jgi:hypothetical protein